MAGLVGAWIDMDDVVAASWVGSGEGPAEGGDDNRRFGVLKVLHHRERTVDLAATVTSGERDVFRWNQSSANSQAGSI